MNEEKIKTQILDACSSSGADFLEIRVEETDSTRINFKAKKLDNLIQNQGLGGNVRALVKGGWGFVCFNNLNNLKDNVKSAVMQAKRASRKNFVPLAEVKPVKDKIVSSFSKSASEIKISEKIHLLKHYNDLIWSTEGIQSSDLIYGDSVRKIFLVNSFGTELIQDSHHVVFRASVQAREGGDVQQSGFSIGSLGDYSVVQGLDNEIKDTVNKAKTQLLSKPVDGGEKTVVLDPILAGVFVHEAFGHLSEADHVYENDQLKEMMVLGKIFGPKNLNIVDGAQIPNLRGSFKYDDEGTPSSKTDLIREGVLVGRLHSRETAAIMKERPTGNARSIGYNFPPIVRMTNTLIENGDSDLSDMFGDIKEGIYAKNWYGGMTSMEMFTFSSGESYMIRNGKVEEMVRPVMLSGNVFSTLHNIDAIGKDLDMNQGGGCGKGGQMPLPVSNGSPHIRIQNCLVSGN